MKTRNIPKHPGAMTPAEQTRKALRTIHTAIVGFILSATFTALAMTLYAFFN